MTAQQGELANGWKYTLTGFGEFLEMRRVTFAEPIPTTRLCGVCGLLPCRTLLLPCHHVLCVSCRDQLPRGNDCRCPFDGKKFSDSEVHQMTVELEKRRILCSAGSEVCGFSGTLYELSDHLTRCGGGKVKCSKCQRPVFRGDAVNHYRGCTGHFDTADSEAASETSDVDESTWEPMLSKGDFDCFERALTEKVANLEHQLLDVQEKSRGDVATLERQLIEMREKSSADVASSLRQLAKKHEKTFNDVDILERRVVSLERQLLEVQEKANSDTQSAVATVKKAAVIQGPLRPAPKCGVFVTTCKFADICAELGSMNEGKKELKKSTGTYTLGGYTFELQCKFTKDGNITKAAFALFLRDGEWDSYLDWPFGKKVTLTIMRPRNPAKDIRLPVNMDGHDLVKQPNVNSWNNGRFTATVNWQDIELQGYVDRGALYVNVEFE